MKSERASSALGSVMVPSSSRVPVPDDLVPGSRHPTGDTGTGNQEPVGISGPVGRNREPGTKTTSGSEQVGLRTPTPIVKWAGGKAKLIPELVKRLPSSYGRYYEPFAGGAALFFALAAKRAHSANGEASRRAGSPVPVAAAFGFEPKELRVAGAPWAVLGDANADLMAMYQAVRDDAEAVIKALEFHAAQHGEAHYYGVRDAWNARELVARPLHAAAFLYLNKTCFNGLWRVNKSGAFNVPMGSYKNPTICNAAALRAASWALGGAELVSGDYLQVIADAEAGDLVYFDPPYDASFASYTLDAFEADDQRALAEVARELGRRGCHVVLSNRDTPFVRSLYQGFVIERVKNPHMINSDGTGRSDVDEVIITHPPHLSGRATSGRRARKQATRSKRMNDDDKTPVEPPAEHIMQFFAYAHLPQAMQDVSRPFCELAQRVLATTARNPERTVALRKLLEAKDAAVRAAIAK